MRQPTAPQAFGHWGDSTRAGPSSTGSLPSMGPHRPGSPVTREGRGHTSRKPRLPRIRGMVLSAVALLSAGALAACSVSPLPAPRFTSPAQAAFQAGENSRFTIRIASFSGRVTEQGSLPAGLSFRRAASGATISGIPGPTSGGVYPVTLAAIQDSGDPVSQHLSIIVDAAPRFLLSKKTQWGFALGHLTFRVTAPGYPAPRITLASALPPGLRLQVHGDVATISGRLQLSWLKTILAAAGMSASVILGLLTGGTSFIAEIGIADAAASAVDVGSSSYDFLCNSYRVTLVAANSVSTKEVVLTMRILGPN